MQRARRPADAPPVRIARVPYFEPRRALSMRKPPARSARPAEIEVGLISGAAAGAGSDDASTFEPSACTANINAAQALST